jgi:hypothetical protein
VITLPITKRGVYHNLKESKYVVSNADITFFFSSEHTLNKFMNGYEKHREVLNKTKLKSETNLNLDTFADIFFYKESEKRGFYVWLKGVSIGWDELHQYSVRNMLNKESPLWIQIERPKVGERFGR